MIQAEPKHWNYLDFDDSISAVPVRKRQRPVRSNTIARLSFFILIFCVAFTYLNIQASLMGYKIVELKKDIANLDTDNKKLDLQIAELSSLDRVQQVAEKNMGMYRPDTNCMIAMAGEEKIVPVVHVEGKPVKEEPVITMKSLYKGIASVFTNTRTLSMKD